MRIRRVQRAAVFAAGFAMAVGTTALASAATAQPAVVRGVQPTGIQHVLLISVDGLHQQDLTWYVDNFPDSTLATLDHQGTEYSAAMTPFPSDSFPGMVGQVTGGDPKVTRHLLRRHLEPRRVPGRHHQLLRAGARC
jgi:Type I phosphodiesterase / nucleotide pyrophosphatase